MIELVTMMITTAFDSTNNNVRASNPLNVFASMIESWFDIKDLPKYYNLNLQATSSK